VPCNRFLGGSMGMDSPGSFQWAEVPQRIPNNHRCIWRIFGWPLNATLSSGFEHMRA
jgi:hypothetical protein